jgi:hypothetical protein
VGDMETNGKVISNYPSNVVKLQGMAAKTYFRQVMLTESGILTCENVDKNGVRSR